MIRIITLLLGVSTPIFANPKNMTCPLISLVGEQTSTILEESTKTIRWLSLAKPSSSEKSGLLSTKYNFSLNEWNLTQTIWETKDSIPLNTKMISWIPKKQNWEIISWIPGSFACNRGQALIRKQGSPSLKDDILTEMTAIPFSGGWIFFDHKNKSWHIPSNLGKEPPLLNLPKDLDGNPIAYYWEKDQTFGVVVEDKENFAVEKIDANGKILGRLALFSPMEDVGIVDDVVTLFHTYVSKNEITWKNTNTPKPVIAAFPHSYKVHEAGLFPIPDSSLMVAYAKQDFVEKKWKSAFLLDSKNPRAFAAFLMGKDRNSIRFLGYQKDITSVIFEERSSQDQTTTVLHAYNWKSKQWSLISQRSVYGIR